MIRPRTMLTALLLPLAAGLGAARAQDLTGAKVDDLPGVTSGAEGAPKPVPATLGDSVGTHIPVQFGATLGGYYDDNIYIQPAGPGRQSDFIWSVAPLIGYNSSADTGTENSFQVSYSPSFIFYQDHSVNDTIDQVGSALYAYHGARTDFILRQEYLSLQNNSPDLGDLTTYEEYITQANLDYQLTGKIALNFKAEQDIIDYDEGFNSNEWTGSLYALYEAMPKTTIGLGGLIGFADTDGPNQTFEQANVRVVWNPTTKLSINGTVGAELRQTQGLSGSTLTPDFSLGADYDPTDGTNLNLNAYRHYAYSAKFFGEDYLATGVAVSVSQRLCHQLYASVAGSYENAAYRNNFTGADSGPNYDYYSVRPSLSFKPTEWCELNAYYQYRRNISQTINGFVDNQVGFESRFIY